MILIALVETIVGGGEMLESIYYKPKSPNHPLSFLSGRCLLLLYTSVRVALQKGGKKGALRRLYATVRTSFLLVCISFASIDTHLMQNPAMSEVIPSSSTEASTTFKDISASAGVKIFQTTYGNPIAGDFNNDGNEDVFVSNHKSPPSLFRNNGNGTFTDIRAVSGITSNGDRHGAAWGDYNNDGNLDLFITIGGDHGNAVGTKTDQLYRNNGNGTFTDVTALSGVDNHFGRGRSVNWVDFNNDGYLDLFIKNWQTPNVLYRNNGDGTFTDVASSAGIADAPGQVSSWADYDNDGYMDLFITSGAKDQLWRNNGDGTFTEVTSLAGLKNVSYGQGVAWGDYNNDGNIDLYIARGYNDVEDSLSWNASLIAFSDVATTDEDGIDFSTSGGEVTFDLFLADCHKPGKVFIGGQRLSPSNVPFTISELDASGRPSYTPGQDIGFFIWMDENGWHIRWSSNGAYTYFYGRISTEAQFLSALPLNFTRKKPSVTATLYRNNGDGTFTDVTSVAGVGSKQNSRGAVWGDYDNDGRLDLYVVNSGSFERNKSNALYRNNGDGTFSNVTGEAKVWASVNGSGRGDGAAWVDFNNDGHLDLYVTNGWGEPIFATDRNQNCLSPGPHILYMNNGNGNNWLKIKLVGTVSNRDGVGAKVTLQAGGLKQFREMNGGGGGQFFAQGSGLLHFGLDEVSLVDSITIKWPSGITQTLTNTPANQSINVVEGQLTPP
jgi:ASPIC and UnbV/FG-GAP-like repeat